MTLRSACSIASGNRGVQEEEDVVVGVSGDGAVGVPSHATGGTCRGAMAVPEPNLESHDDDVCVTRDAGCMLRDPAVFDRCGDRRYNMWFWIWVEACSVSLCTCIQWSCNDIVILMQCCFGDATCRECCGAQGCHRSTHRSNRAAAGHAQF